MTPYDMTRAITQLVSTLFIGMGLICFIKVVCQRAGIWRSFLGFYVIVFSVTYFADDIWQLPLSPRVCGGWWLPVVIIGVAFAFFFAAMVPVYSASLSTEDHEEKPCQPIVNAFNFAVWLVLVMVIIIILMRYRWHGVLL